MGKFCAILVFVAITSGLVCFYLAELTLRAAIKAKSVIDFTVAMIDATLQVLITGTKSSDVQKALDLHR